MGSRIIRFSEVAVPKPLRGAFINYIGRIGIWHKILQNVNGISAADRCWLWLSLAASPFTAFGGFDEWRDPVLLKDISARVRGVGTFKLRAYTDDLLHVLPTREPEVFRYIKDHLKSGSTFVDAGANIGFYSVAARNIVGADGKVISIEMIEGTARRLELHMSLNGYDTHNIIRRALSDTDGDFVSATTPTGFHGRASIINSSDGACTVETVQTATIDSLLAHIDHIDVLKFDIEGAELRALRGASRTLQRIRAIIFEHWSDHELRELSHLLETSGFTVLRLGAHDSVAVRL